MSWIPVIINPAAGRRAPVMAELNQVFRDAGVRWSVEITQEEGDGVRLARQLVEQGAEIVAVYGGDGTISEVATGNYRPLTLSIDTSVSGDYLARTLRLPWRAYW